MEIKYRAKGTKREELIKAVSELVGKPPKDLGTPSFGCQIGDLYTVTKDGNLILSDKVTSFEGEPLLYELFERGFVEQGDEDEIERYEIRMASVGYEEKIKDYLNCILAANATLIKEALNVDTLKINIYKDCIGFPWFKDEPSPEDRLAYQEFLSSLIKTAINHYALTHNDKLYKKEYAIRILLNHIGLNGDKYEKAREILTRNFN